MTSMTGTSMSERLIAENKGIQERILAHPFVQGIGRGDLPLEPFVFYIRQDYVYLIEFSRVMALAVAKAHDLEVMGLFAELTQATLNVEMELHRGYCERFGVSREELAETEAAPVTHAYTRHLLAVAHQGTIAEIMASLLPCEWGYREIGLHLAAQGLPAEQPLYAEWIEMYSGQEFGELAERLRKTFDRVAAGVSAAEAARIATIYRTSTRYEYAFWEAAYQMQDWPL